MPPAAFHHPGERLVAGSQPARTILLRIVSSSENRHSFVLSGHTGKCSETASASGHRAEHRRARPPPIFSDPANSHSLCHFPARFVRDIPRCIFVTVCSCESPGSENSSSTLTSTARQLKGHLCIGYVRSRLNGIDRLAGYTHFACQVGQPRDFRIVAKLVPYSSRSLPTTQRPPAGSNGPA